MVAVPVVNVSGLSCYSWLIVPDLGKLYEQENSYSPPFNWPYHLSRKNVQLFCVCMWNGARQERNGRLLLSNDVDESFGRPTSPSMANSTDYMCMWSYYLLLCMYTIAGDEWNINRTVLYIANFARHLQLLRPKFAENATKIAISNAWQFESELWQELGDTNRERDKDWEGKKRPAPWGWSKKDNTTVKYAIVVHYHFSVVYPWDRYILFISLLEIRKAAPAQIGVGVGVLCAYACVCAR